MNKKYLAVIALVLIIGVAVFVFIPLTRPTGLSIQFYKDGQPVGKPLSTFPLGAIFLEGKEVDTFTITVNWQTSDPNTNWIDWVVHLKVEYLKVDDPMNPVFGVVFDEDIWSGSQGRALWLTGVGSLTSGHYPVDAFHEVPENSAFTLEFSGTFRFLLDDIDTVGREVLFEGIMPTLTVNGYHGEYEYLCWVSW